MATLEAAPRLPNLTDNHVQFELVRAMANVDLEHPTPTDDQKTSDWVHTYAHLYREIVNSDADLHERLLSNESEIHEAALTEMQRRLKEAADTTAQ